MKDNLKKEVLHFLQNLPKETHERYNQAFGLYRRTEGCDYSSERTYNQGFSDANLKNLLYDLQKLNKISDLEIRKKATVSSDELVNNIDVEVTGDSPEGLQSDSASDSEESSETDTADTDENNPAAGAEGSSETDTSSETDENTPAADSEESPEIDTSSDTAENTPAPPNEKEDFKASPSSEERLRLRDQFTFLREEDCPLELKALVTDKITAYENYSIAQGKLVNHTNGTAVLSDEDLAQATKDAVTEFEANQAIFEELNYYAANKKVLGLHPIFRSLTLQREVNSMGPDELQSFINSSPKFFSTKKGLLTRENAKKPKDLGRIADLEKSVELRKEKLSLVKAKLGLSGK
jgi:hypothetical protein